MQEEYLYNLIRTARKSPNISYMLLICEVIVIDSRRECRDSSIRRWYLSRFTWTRTGWRLRQRALSRISVVLLRAQCADDAICHCQLFRNEPIDSAAAHKQYILGTNPANYEVPVGVSEI